MESSLNCVIAAHQVMPSNSAIALSANSSSRSSSKGAACDADTHPRRMSSDRRHRRHCGHHSTRRRRVVRPAPCHTAATRIDTRHPSPPGCFLVRAPRLDDKPPARRPSVSASRASLTDDVALRPSQGYCRSDGHSLVTPLARSSTHHPYSPCPIYRNQSHTPSNHIRCG